jgi:Holliday junction resolvase RusA-like endonuclease
MILKIQYRGKVKSVNHTYQFNRKTGQMYMVKDVKDFKKEIGQLASVEIINNKLKKQYPISKGNDVYIIVIYYHTTDKCLDTSNSIKAIQDALNKIVYDDDKQITDATMNRKKEDYEGLDIYVINNKIEYFNTRVELGV